MSISPKATAADIEPAAHPLERPPQVVLAVKLAWAGIILGLSALAVSWEYYSSLGSTTSMVLGQGFGVLIALWIYYKIYVGRNWARVLYLVLVIVGLLIFINGAARGAILAAPPIARFSSVLNLALNLAVIWLVFTPPGGAWFKRARRAPAA